MSKRRGTERTGSVKKIKFRDNMPLDEQIEALDVYLRSTMTRDPKVTELLKFIGDLIEQKEFDILEDFISSIMYNIEWGPTEESMNMSKAKLYDKEHELVA